MLRLTRIPALFCAIITVSGCEKVSGWIAEQQYAGTTFGYHRCITDNSDLSLSQETVKQLCRAKHESIVEVEIEGQAGYRCDYGYGYCNFSGYMYNRSKDTVVTALQIAVRHEDNKDSNGRVQDEVLSFDELWIEPVGNNEVVADVKFKPSEGRLRKGEEFLYSWKVVKTQGIKIKLK